MEAFHKKHDLSDLERSFRETGRASSSRPSLHMLSLFAGAACSFVVVPSLHSSPTACTRSLHPVLQEDRKMADLRRLADDAKKMPAILSTWGCDEELWAQVRSKAALAKMRETSQESDKELVQLKKGAIEIRSMANQPFK